jgi:beta-mannosidase
MARRTISLSETCQWQFNERNLSLSIIQDSTSNGWKAVNSMPSDVYAELRDSGDIPDPLVGFNEHKVQWVADKEWIYRTSFEGENLPEGRIQLVFEGLDTYCTVYLVSSNRL